MIDAKSQARCQLAWHVWGSALPAGETLMATWCRVRLVQVDDPDLPELGRGIRIYVARHSPVAFH